MNPEIEKLPIASININILKFWSFILVHNYRRYLALIPTSALNVGQFVNLFSNTQSIEILVQNIYATVLWFNTIFRAYYLILNSRKFEKVLDTMATYYIDIKSNGDNIMQMYLDDVVRSIQRISYLNMCIGFFTIIGLLIYPLFVNQRVLPFNIHYFGLKQYESPHYEILYIYDILITPIGCCMYIPFTSVIVTYMFFSIVMLKILQYRLKSLSTSQKSNIILSTELAWCVEYHTRIIRFIKEINYLTRYVSLVEFLTFSGTLCALLFLLNIAASFIQMIIVCWFMLMIVMQLFLAYWFANEILTESLKVSEAAYNAPWYDFSLKNQKKIIIILIRSQKSLVITIGKLYPMTLESFQSLLNATYSYFTILRRFYA